MGSHRGTMKEISVIIPVYMVEGSKDMHRGMLVNFDATVDRQAIELIIVDNGSAFDGDFMIPYADKYAKIQEQIGFTKAINLGISQATGDYICQMNTDVKHEKRGWLEKMRELCDKTGGIITAGSEQGPDLILNQAYGACWMMHRSILDRVGPWDEDNFNYRFSDQDYWIRATQAGVPVYESREAWIVHEEKFTWSRMDKDLRERVTEEERLRMIEKYGVTNFHEWLLNQKK